MSERISRTQAIVRIMLATNLARADAAEWLDDEFPTPLPERPVHRDAVNRYAGGLTYVDLEADPRMAAVYRSDDIDLSDLEDALADLLGPRSSGGPETNPPKAEKTEKSAQRAATARAVRDLWDGVVPDGLTVERRDELIIDFARKNALAVPSERTIRRYFKGQ